MAHRRFGAFYARSFERRPWLTLAVANGTLGALADTLAQTLERWPGSSQRGGEKKLIEGTADTTTTPSASDPWDLNRTARFFAFGVGMAPLLAEWNRWIEHRFPLRPANASNVAKVSLSALGKRVAVDQILFAPFGLLCFVGAMGFMEGRSAQGVGSKLQEMYWPALTANWQLWPLVQTINFRFLPLRYRVPFTGAVGIAWQVFLSILNAGKGKASAVQQTEKRVTATSTT